MAKETTPSQRHPDSIAWENWKNSPDGRAARNARTLGLKDPDTYLTNRLQSAFEAGVKYAECKK